MWRLRGYDTFEGVAYDIPGEYKTERAAQAAARKRLKELEKTQPSSSSGGQGFAGIQSRVSVIRPDGSGYRFTG